MEVRKKWLAKLPELKNSYNELPGKVSLRVGEYLDDTDNAGRWWEAVEQIYRHEARMLAERWAVAAKASLGKPGHSASEQSDEIDKLVDAITSIPPLRDRASAVSKAIDMILGGISVAGTILVALLSPVHSLRGLILTVLAALGLGAGAWLFRRYLQKPSRLTLLTMKATSGDIKRIVDKILDD
jgi:hypothetical protein